MTPASHSPAALPVPVAVLGTGPAGLAAALALAREGVPVQLIGPRPTAGAMAADTRTTALFGGSIELLRHIDVWPALAPTAAPLRGLRLIDCARGAPLGRETVFLAEEIGRHAFGFNIENAVLVAALVAAAEAAPSITWHATSATLVERAGDGVAVSLETGGRIETRLLVAADGRDSPSRAAADVAVRTWSYPQAALALRFDHSRPHHGVSSELHRRHGPLTTVPLTGHRSSLVWVDEPAAIDRLMRLPDDDLSRELAGHLDGLLGRIAISGRRATFPLTGLVADPMAANRIALVGEAAHRLPPIGAQGLNLGLRDGAWIAAIAADALRSGKDPGGAATLAAYVESRRGDVGLRAAAVDLLNRSLIADLLPLDLARGLALGVVGNIPMLRRIAMREGMEPAGPLPRLLQPV